MPLDSWMLIACATAAIGCGLVSGVFLAFSDFIMKSLALMPVSGGIEAMQRINQKVYGSVFLILFMALAALCLVLAGYGIYRFGQTASAWIVGASALYLLGAFASTVVFNIPMNKRLDRVDIATMEAADVWAGYLTSWTAWNHVRVIASTGAMICFLLASLKILGT